MARWGPYSRRFHSVGRARGRAWERWSGELVISNGKKSEWSPIRSVIIRVINNKIARESDLLSLVWLQIKLDDTKSQYHELIIKIAISEKRWIAKLWRRGKICIKILTKEALTFCLLLGIRRQNTKAARTYVTTTLNVIGWFKLQLWMWMVDLN